MKHIIIIFLVIMFVAGFADAQTRYKPTAIIKAKFDSLYPGIKDVDWVMFGNDTDEYEAIFIQNGLTVSVNINSRFNQVSKQVSLPDTLLPINIRNYIKLHYPNYEHEQAENVDADNTVSYTVWLREINNPKSYILIFNASGKITDTSVHLAGQEKD